MRKPSNYDETQVGGNFTPITAGGHRCVIKQVNETYSETDNHYAMLKVFFDTDNTDAQPNYFSNLYMGDQQSKGKDAKWRGFHNTVTDERCEYGTGNLKSFITAVETSNDGFAVQWIEDPIAFGKQFVGKRVGVVFGEEEFRSNTDGSIKTSCKSRYFCNYDKATEMTIPKKKELEPAKPVQQGYSAWQNQTVTPTAPMQEAAQEGFMQIPDELSDEGLPFN